MSGDTANFGQIEIGIFSKSLWAQHHTEDHLKIYYKRGEVLSLKNIICDYQAMKSIASRKMFVAEFAKKNAEICEFKSVEEVYGLIEVIILFVIRHRYKNNIVCSNYYREVSEFVEWVFYDEDNMDAHAWTIEKFAEKFDDILSAVSTSSTSQE